MSPDLLFVVGLLLGILIGVGALGVFVWVRVPAAEEWVADNYNSELQWTPEHGLQAVARTQGQRVVYLTTDSVTNDPAVRVP